MRSQAVPPLEATVTKGHHLELKIPLKVLPWFFFTIQNCLKRLHPNINDRALMVSHELQDMQDLGFKMWESLIISLIIMMII